MDAPIHFSRDGRTVGHIPVGDLVVPRGAVDVSARAADHPDTDPTLPDIRDRGSRFVPLPRRCCLAVSSGSDRFATGPG